MAPDPMKSFDELLNQAIEQLGISDSELARAVGVSRQTVFRWRGGHTSRPRRREDVLVIAEKLRLTAEERDELLLAAGFRPEAVATPAEPPSPALEPAPLAPTAELSDAKRPRWALAAGAALVVAVFLLWWLVLHPTDDNLDLAAATATPQPNSTATPTQELAASVVPVVTDERLVVVLRSEATESGQRWTAALTEALHREAYNNRLTEVRVAELVSAVEVAARAKQAGSEMGAAGVLYADFTGDRPVVHWFNLALESEAELAWLQAEFDRYRPLQSKAIALLALSQLYLIDQVPEQMVTLLAQANTALQDDEQALQQTQSLVFGLLCRGYAYARQGAPALNYCQEAIELDSQPIFLEARGMAHLLLDDRPAAVADFEICIDRWQDPAGVSRIEGWLEALEAGNDPLTSSVLTGRWQAMRR